MEKIKYKRGVLISRGEREEDIIEIDESALDRIDGTSSNYTINGIELYISIRGGGQFRGRALYLSDNFEWALCKDDENAVCLIPLKKEKK